MNMTPCPVINLVIMRVATLFVCFDGRYHSNRSPPNIATVLTEQAMSRADAWRMIRLARLLQMFTCRSEITHFGRLASQHILAMAAFLGARVYSDAFKPAHDEAI